MTPEEFSATQAAFGGALAETEVKARRCVSRPRRTAAASVRQLRELGFEYLNCLSGVDWLTHLEVVYDLSRSGIPPRPTSGSR